MSSPFTSKLDTNYCPKDEEVVEIRDLLVEPTLRLKHLDDEIAELQRAIDKLAAERDAVAIFVDAHKALISPARRLPLDIIQEIFIACLPTHRNCVMSASEAPVLLGRLCSSWRAISLSTPRLWATLHVCEPYSSAIPPSELHKRYEQRLEAMTQSREDDISWGSFFRAIIPFASRWRKIGLMNLAPILVEALSHLTEDDVPILQSFTFTSDGVLYGEQQRWSSVRILHGDSVLKLLSHCPALQTCRLSVVEWRPSSPVATSVVECPCLTSLYLMCSGDPAAVLQRIFGFLLVPQLRHFEFEGQATPDSNFDSDFSSFHAGSKELESLSIHSSVLQRPAFFTLLRGLPPTMRRLEITVSWDFTVSNDILTLLAPIDMISPLCPALREFVIKQCSSSDEALMHCLKSRLASKFCERLEDINI
ncbi:hypothetical protein B0H16DRAFT_1688121 [Mycena metata]|uniref:F-box domain-containing protein n=1 Tax=Mycena metata TaxID=1033252 RepID=A0AAD7NJ93_9AGAR|nr:hypothetical protein B0H16DRAFT_1688121 [Mycena metata]